MTNDPREKLKSNIVAVIEGLRHLDVDSAADLIAEISDEIAEGFPEDLFNGAILDGIRWGYTASVQVEMGGGAMLRAILPGGVGITHQWADEDTAAPQIKAALANLHTARVNAKGVGE